MCPWQDLLAYARRKIQHHLIAVQLGQQCIAMRLCHSTSVGGDQQCAACLDPVIEGQQRQRTALAAKVLGEVRPWTKGFQLRVGGRIKIHPMAKWRTGLQIPQ
ncbi:Mu-like prophage tail protein gpP [Pseudomonas syringae pv. actinidiae]|uniref:Mu-like prophage tail protein gpP n=1 Tax=Pseudomonas syringae pv. actinidiae TaxID=103796 RepID=A0A2V0QQP2_PSESF|nr:Mu-like prophage tail protein gpP [Pseudomonas syringae pv. actinidiae]